jgi:hypothetical protein
MLCVDYVVKTIHQLPNLYATKVTNSFQHNLKDKKPFHWVSTESTIVRYRDGQEILSSSEFQTGAGGCTPVQAHRVFKTQSVWCGRVNSEEPVPCGFKPPAYP